GPGGGLEFEVKLQDWKVEDYLDTRNLTGDYAIRVRLLRGGQTVDEKDKTVVVDGTPPEGEFRSAGGSTVPPKAQRKGRDTAVRVRSFGDVKLTAEASDPESKIQEVIFFLGEPENDKRPPKAREARVRPPDDAPDRWQASASLFIAPNLTEQLVSIE